MLKKAADQLVNASRYSFAGFNFLIRSELASRLEIYVFAFALALYWFLDAPWIHFLIGAVLMFLILAVEAINTAIEVIIDRISPEISDTGKHAKDLGSFAVMCLTFCNGIHMSYVVLSSLFPENGVRWLACVVIFFFAGLAVYTKFHQHRPRRQKD